jgi:hypothetical protein
MVRRWIASLAAGLSLVCISAGTSLAAPGNATVVRSPSSGRVEMLRFDVGTRQPGLRTSATLRPTPEAAKATAMEFILAYRDLIPLRDPTAELVAGAVVSDELNFTHLRYQQVWQGLPVLGGEVGVHLDPNGQVYLVDTKIAEGLPLNTVSALDAGRATTIALARGADESRRQLTLPVRPAQLDESKPQVALPVGPARLDESTPQYTLTAGPARLVVLPISLLTNQPGSNTLLAWEVEVGDEPIHGRFAMIYFVDAATGAVAYARSNIRSLNRNIYDLERGTSELNVYDSTSGYTFGRSEGQPPRGPAPETGHGVSYNANYQSWWGYPAYLSYAGNSAVDSVYAVFSTIQDYIAAHFGLDGANNAGGTGFPTRSSWDQTRAYVNVDNAGIMNCPGMAAGYYTGSGDIYFCQGQTVPDIQGHEYGHAILQVLTRFRDLAGYPVGPVFDGQSASLQEAFADFFGEVIENQRWGANDWRMGTGSLGGTARYLDNPPSSRSAPGDNFTVPCGSGICGYPYPSRYFSSSRTCPGGPDYGDNHGAHRNSTIISHAFYRMAVGGPDLGCDVNPIGTEAAIQIFWRAWNSYFAANENFYPQAYNHILQAAADLYPPSTVDQVRNALQSSQLDQDACAPGAIEAPPPCAVRHVSNAATYKPWSVTQTPIASTVFAPGEFMTVKGCGNMPNATVRLSIVPNQFDIDSWYSVWQCSGFPWTDASYTETGSTDASGCFSITFSSPLATYTSGATTYGDYYVLIEGGGDALYEQWSDMHLEFVIKAPVSGDGICQAGSSPATNEDCHRTPADCACSADTCVATTADPEGAWACSSQLVGVESARQPRLTTLHLARPNPFRGTTEFAYDLAQAGPVELGVYDVLGRQLRRLVSGWRPAGYSQSVLWDGRDDAGRALPAGVYLCSLKSGTGRVLNGVRKVLLVR